MLRVGGLPLNELVRDSPLGRGVGALRAPPLVVHRLHAVALPAAPQRTRLPTRGARKLVGS